MLNRINVKLILRELMTLDMYDSNAVLTPPRPRLSDSVQSHEYCIMPLLYGVGLSIATHNFKTPLINAAIQDDMTFTNMSEDFVIQLIQMRLLYSCEVCFVN